MAISELMSPRDIQRAKFIFEMFDIEAKDRMDTFYLGDALRSLNFIPTLEMVRKLGGNIKKGENFITIEEFLPIVHEISQTKDMGSYEVFVECLRLYDRHENGTLLVSDLQNILMNMGEEMEAEEVKEVIDECCEEEDEDGCIPYESFLQKLCQGPHED